MIGREKIAETLRTPGRGLRRRPPARPREGTAVSDGPLPADLVRRPHRAAGRALPGVPRRAPTTRSSTPTRPSWACIREFQQSMNEDFRKEWEAKTGDGGLHAAYDSDARNERLDGEGVAAEVLFPDADVLGTGRVASSPFGSGLGNPTGLRPASWSSPGPGPTTAGWPTSAPRSPHRRIGVAVVPIVHDIDAAVDRDPRGRPTAGLRGVMIPTRWFDEPAYHEPRLRARVGGGRGAGPGAAHPLRRRPGRLRARPGLHGHLRHRGVLVGGPPAVGPALGGRVRAPPRPAVRHRRERRLVGARHRRQDGREVRRRAQHQEARATPSASRSR